MDEEQSGAGGMEGGNTAGILGFFSNFFTYRKEQDIMLQQLDAQKYFQKGRYTPPMNYDYLFVGFLLVVLLVLFFFFRKK